MAIPHSPLLAFDRFGFRHRLPLFAAKCGVGKKGRIKYCRSNWSSQNETGCSRKRSNVRKHVDPGAPHHYRDLSLASNSSGSLPRPVVSSYFRQVDETKWGRARGKKKKKLLSVARNACPVYVLSEYHVYFAIESHSREHRFS